MGLDMYFEVKGKEIDLRKCNCVHGWIDVNTEGYEPEEGPYEAHEPYYARSPLASKLQHPLGALSSPRSELAPNGKVLFAPKRAFFVRRSSCTLKINDEQTMRI